MRSTAYTLLPLLVCLPALTQTREVTVERAEIVQVSSSEDSPNITKVTGNVSVTIYKCTNVTYCGSAYFGDHMGTYSFASTANDPRYVPMNIPAHVAFTGTASESAGMMGLYSSFAGSSSSFSDPAYIGLLGKTPGLDSLYSGSTGTDVFAGIKPHRSFEKAQADGLDASLADGIKLFSAPNSPIAATSGTSLYGVPGILGQSPGTSSIALGSVPAFDHIGVINSSDKIGIDYSSIEYTIKSWRERFAASTSDGTNAILGMTEPYSLSSVGTASGLVASPLQSTDHNSLSDLKLSGGQSDYSPYLKAGFYNSSATTFGTGTGTGFYLSKLPSSFANGFDKDSLARQLEELSKTNKKIVGWTIFIEEDQGNR